MKIKIKFRLLSIVLVCLIVFSAIPVTSLVSANNTNVDILINDYDDVTDITAAVYSADIGVGVEATFDENIKYTEEGKSIKFTTIPAATSSYRRARLNVSGADSEAKGFKIWMKNPSQTGVNIAIQFVKDSSWINMKPLATYYTLDTAGQVTQHFYKKKVGDANEGCIYLKGGFEGFVYLPLSSGFSTITADQADKIVVSAYTEAGSPVTYYVDHLMTYSDIGDENWILRSFSDYTDTEDMKKHMTYGTTSIELDKENNACVIDTGTLNQTTTACFRIGKETINNEHTGMRVRIKTSGDAATNILFKWETSRHCPLKSNAEYFLVDSAGNIYAKKASNDSSAARVTIPANFEGWLYVPFASSNGLTKSDIWRVYLNADVEDVPGRKLSVYEISLYKELPLSEDSAFIINNFEDYESTNNLKDALVYGNTTPLTVSLEEDAWGSRGLGILQSEKEMTAAVAVSFGKTAITSEFEGFKVRIKANKNANILIKSEDNTHRPMKSKSLYYLVSSDGRAYSYRASNDSAALVQFAAGFDGWIYIPFTSLNNLNKSQAYRLWFNPQGTNEKGTQFIIDDVSLYSKNPTVINETPIDFKVVLPYDSDDNLLNFDDCTTTPEMSNKIKLNSGKNVTVSLDTSVAQEKNSCKFEFSDEGGNANNIVTIKKNSYYSEITGFRFWVKISEGDEPVSLLYKLETAQHRPIKSKATYFTADSEGKVNKLNASADSSAAIISLPSGYEGWVYVPFSSIYPMEIADLYRIWFNFTVGENAPKTIWLDSISCYKDNPVPTNLNVINDFESYYTTEDVKGALVRGTTTPLDLELVKDAWGSNGLKFTQKEKGVGGNFAVSFDASENTSQYKGFKVRIKVNKAANILLKSEDDLHRPMKAKSVYYLVSCDGRGYSYTASSDTASYVQFESGFDGWIYIPFSTLTGIDLNKAYRLWFCPEEFNEAGTEFLIDDIIFYSENPTILNDTPIPFKRVLPYDSDNNLLNFDDCTTTEEMSNKIKLNSGKNVTVSLDTSVAQEKNSCKFEFSDEGGNANNIVAIKKNSYYSEIAGFRFWVKTTEGDEGISLLYKLETGQHRPLKNKATYYITDSNGNAVKRNASADNEAAIIAIPAGYEGWIYVPFNSIYPMEIADLYRIWFNFTAGKDAPKTIWLDSISCYKENPEVKESDIINDFDIYSGTSDLLLDSSFQAQSEEGNYSISKTHFDGKSGKSFKIKTVNSAYKFSGLKNFDVSKYHGFVFYVNNPSDKEAYIMPQTDSKGRDSFIGGAGYFIEDITTGKVEMGRFGKIIKDAGNVTIPGGFKGYIYIPFSSAYPSLQNNIDKLNALWLNIRGDMVTNSELYIDTIAFYNNNTCRISETLVWKEDTPNTLYGFEKSDSLTGYRGWINGPENLDVSINKKYANSGKNSLKVSTPLKNSEEAKNTWSVLSFSLKNEDGTYNPVNMYDGIAFWVKVEPDGTDTKPLSNNIQLGFKVDMPSHGRLHTNSPIYVMREKDGLTNPEVHSNFPEGCSAIELETGFSGMIYIPFSELKGFTSTDILDANDKLTKIYIMFRLHSLIGYNVYIDDIQGFNMEDLKNVQWPGDPNYNPLDDAMLKISNEKYVAKTPMEVVNNSTEKEIGLLLPIVIGAVAIIICSIGVVAFLLLKKKKSKKA